MITSFAGEEVEDIVALRKILYEEKQIGDEVEVVYYCNGKKHKTSVILEEHK